MTDFLTPEEIESGRYLLDASFEPEEQLRYTIGKLESTLREYAAVVERLANGNTTIVSHGDHCKFCGAGNQFTKVENPDPMGPVGYMVIEHKDDCLWLRARRLREKP